jgi:hypothetical protein
MAVDLLAEVACHADRHLHLIVTHHGKAAVGRRTQIVSGNIHLDVVYAFAATQAHNLPYFLRAVGDHAEALVIHMRLALVAQAAGDRYLGACRTDARTGKLSRVDGIADDYIEAQLRGCGAVGAGKAMVKQRLGIANG